MCLKKKSLKSLTWTCTNKSGAFITFGHYHSTDFTFEHLFTSGHYSACKIEKISCPLEQDFHRGYYKTELQNCFPLEDHSHLSNSTPQFKRKQPSEIFWSELSSDCEACVMPRAEEGGAKCKGQQAGRSTAEPLFKINHRNRLTGQHERGEVQVRISTE